MRRNLLAKGYHALMSSFNPLLWYRLNEPSGTDVVNHGSVASMDGTVTNVDDVTVGVDGLLGAVEGIDFEGAAGYALLPVSATVSGIIDYTVIALLSPSAAPGVSGRIIDHADRWFLNVMANGAVQGKQRRGDNATNSDVSTGAGVVTFPTARLALAMTYDETRALRLWRPTVSRANLLATSGGSGSTDTHTTSIQIGNAPSEARGFDGVIDEVAFIEGCVGERDLVRVAKAARIMT